jgi:4-amino-4-deoxy-L-arabinose transferase-like glycosyltransferase
MWLTFFLTLSLCCFVSGQRNLGTRTGKMQFLLMYVAMGVATMIKGPIGCLLPTLVIFFYLLFTKRLTLLRHMAIPLGIPVFILTTAPCYLLAELENPGYLHYFLWEENVARFLATRLNRNQPWYYFSWVLAAGFFPWTVLLPTMIGDLCRRSLKDERLFLILWITLPLLFFSASSSKLPHYILPIYPPLAIIMGATIANPTGDSSTKKRWVTWLPAAVFFLLVLITTLLLLSPDLMPYRLQAQVHDIFPPAPPFAVIVGLQLSPIFALVAFEARLWAKQEFLYSITAFGFALFILVAIPVMTNVSVNRSSKQLAEKAAPLIRDDDQLVLYDSYPSSLPFYLNIQRPIWVVGSENRSKVLGSNYVAERRPEPAPGYGQILFTREEFVKLWKTRKQRLVAFVDRNATVRFELLVGSPVTIILEVGQHVLIVNK